MTPPAIPRRALWLLVVLTFEGSIRIGMLVSFIAQSWRRLMAM